MLKPCCFAVLQPQHRVAGLRSGPASYFDGSSDGAWIQSPGWGHDMGTELHVRSSMT